MIHWQPAFERTKQNICIAMHIALNQGHFEIQSGDVGACKSNHRSNAQAFFRQEGARMPRHGNLPVEQSQHVASPKKIILRKNVPNWDIWNQSRRCFCWKFTMCTEIVHLMWVLCTISEVTQTLILNMFKFLLRKSDNVLQVIGGQQQSDWTSDWKSSITWTWHLARCTFAWVLSCLNLTKHQAAIFGSGKDRYNKVEQTIHSWRSFCHFNDEIVPTNLEHKIN